MANSKVVILAEVSFFKKDSVFKDKYDLYVSNELELITSLYSYSKSSYIDNVELLGDVKNKSYFNVNEPFWGIKFISTIEHNEYVTDGIIENLVEYISDYHSSNIVSLIKDVSCFFGKEKENHKNGIETRKFITIFNEYSYFDSYAGDGDYTIDYLKVVTLKNLSEEVKENKYSFKGLIY